MMPTKLLICGSPKAGTPLRIASPSVAIDLTLKILVAEDANRKVWISYNDAEYLRAQHNLSQELYRILRWRTCLRPEQQSDAVAGTVQSGGYFGSGTSGFG